MAGDLQPLSDKFAIVGPDGCPSIYFIQWAQQRQIDISGSITADEANAIVAAYIADHPTQWGDIAGTLSAQTDLQAALDGKAVLVGGNTFTGDQTVNSGRLTLNGDGTWALVASADSGCLFGATCQVRPNIDGTYPNFIFSAADFSHHLAVFYGPTTLDPDFYFDCDGAFIFENLAESFTRLSLGTSVAAFGIDVTVPDDAYDATTWNGNLEVPTKNALRDKIESMIAGGGVAWGGVTGTLSDQTDLQAALDDKADLTGGIFSGDISVPDDAYGVGWNGNFEVPTKNALYDKIEALPQDVLNAISTTQGAVLYRGAALWTALAPGTAGYYLKTNGAAANPSWDAPTGSGVPTARLVSTPGAGGLAGGGDLSADRSLSIADQASGTLPGTYGSSTKSVTVTVNQKGIVTALAETSIAGSGGSGLGAYWWSGFIPVAADFPTAYTVPSSGGVALTMTDDVDVGIIFDPGAFASGENYRAKLKPTPAAGANWTLTTRMVPNGWTANSNFVGIWLLENDATGKSIFFGMQITTTQAFIVRRQSGQTTGTFVATTATATAFHTPFWLRVRYVFSSTTYFFDFSYDGKAWINLTSVAELTGFTTRPTKMGLGYYINLASGSAKAVASCDYWRVT